MRSNMASQILRRTLGSRYLSNPKAFSSASTPIRATLFPGDGIGPEIADSVKQVPFHFSPILSNCWLYLFECSVCMMLSIILCIKSREYLFEFLIGLFYSCLIQAMLLWLMNYDDDIDMKLACMMCDSAIMLNDMYIWLPVNVIARSKDNKCFTCLFWLYFHV